MQRHVFAIVGLIGLLGGAALLTAPAEAEVRRQTPPQAFSSGAMRSERVLLDIREVLLRMDARLANVERSVAEMRQLVAQQALSGAVKPTRGAGVP